MWDKLVKGAAAIAGAVAGAFGGFDTVLLVLIAFMAVDYVTGLVVAWMGKSHKSDSGGLDSKVGFIGIAKKGLMLLVVLVAAMLDRAIGAEHAMFREMVIWFYMANEGLSLLENLALAGVPFPSRMLKALEQLREKNDEPPETSGGQ